VRITGVEIDQLKIRYRFEFELAGGVPSGSTVFVKILTSDGITGFGEVRPEPVENQGETTASVVGAIKDFYAPLLIGKNPFDVERILFEMDKALPKNQYARMPIDLALYDIAGKRLGTPVHNLLGGLFHEKVPLKFPLGIASKEEMVKEAMNLIERFGVKYLKVKIGRATKWKEDIENVKAIREAVGDEISLQVDANCGYNSVGQALGVIRKLEKYDIAMVEQPIASWNLEGMAEIARSVDIPILADESVFTLMDAYKVIRMKAADVINVKLQKSGGLNMAKKIVAVAEAAGLPIFVGSSVETGVGAAAAAHFYASTCHVWPAAAFMFGPYLLEHHLMVEDPMLSIHDGYLRVPEKPGLGIDIDEQALERYSERRYSVGR
jgi:L-alanine-DL-glutamate epimerase-like enolase superfamily enzyme